MRAFLEYDISMRPSNPSPVAVFSAFVISLFLALPAPAQINGPPASVTSPGFGGNAINGPRASVTSLGPQGYTPERRIPLASAGNGFHQGDRGSHEGRDGRRHHRQDSEFVGPVWYAVPVPYAIEEPVAEDQPDEANDDADYQGGPTVFDRRGSGARSYVPPLKDAPAAHAADRTDQAAVADPAPPVAPTLLVFKDGRTVEVGNYAILGPTLFDLTPGHSRKIAILDLDLEATRRQNDERGVTFQLPQTSQAN